MLHFLNKNDPEGRYVYKHVEDFTHQGKHVIVFEFCPGTTIKQELILGGRKGLSIALIRYVDSCASSHFALLVQIDVLARVQSDSGANLGT